VAIWGFATPRAVQDVAEHRYRKPPMSRLTSLGFALAMGVIAYKVARKLDVSELTAQAREGEAGES
jgi:hypothetical protein